MRCPRCQFENMPGVAACFRCGSLLEAKAGAINVHPPRAPAWKKPFRRVARRMRQIGAARKAERFAHRAAERTVTAAFGDGGSPGLPRVGGAPRGGGLWRVIGAAAAALALSVVPGLAHALRHEFRAIRLYVLSWFGSLALGVIYFGRGFGSASMAAAFVLHAWIAMDAVVGSKPFKERMSALRRLYWRLAGLALGVLLLYAAYVEVRRAVGFTIGLADIAVPADRVELGDVILCRYLGANPEPALRRGDLVLVRASQLVYGDGAHGAHSGYLGETVGQLIALPGDQLRLTREGFVVNGRALDPLEFPVPESLRGDSGPMALGKDEYFVTMEWRVESREVGLAARVAVALRGCVYHRPELLARGVMRWFPLRRRGFLKELE